MVASKPYPARFSVARLFDDATRVLATAWLPLLIGALLLGAAPVVAANLPWWKSTESSASFSVIWAEITSAKTVITLLGFAAIRTFATAVSIGVLDDRAWNALLRPAPLMAGFLASLALTLMATWPVLVEPFALTTAAQPNRGSILTLLLTLMTLASDLLLPPLVGLAASVATREEAPVGTSLIRSFRLLRGLRWRMFGFALAYFVVQAMGQYAVAVPLFYSGVSYTLPGWGRAAVSLPPIVIGALANPIFVSFYLQARRRTDGPHAAELDEVFA